MIPPDACRSLALSSARLRSYAVRRNVYHEFISQTSLKRKRTKSVHGKRRITGPKPSIIYSKHSFSHPLTPPVPAPDSPSIPAVPFAAPPSPDPKAHAQAA